MIVITGCGSQMGNIIFSLILYILLCIVYIVHHTVYIVHYTVSTLHYTYNELNWKSFREEKEFFSRDINFGILCCCCCCLFEEKRIEYKEQMFIFI